MPDAKITALTALTTPTGDDLVAVVNDPLGTPSTMKMAISDLFTYNRQQKRVTADRTSASTTLAAITDLDSFTLAANTVYRFRAVLFVTTNATTVGIHFGVNFTGTTTFLRAGHIVPVAASAVAGASVGVGATGSVNTKILQTTAGPGPSPSQPVVIEGLIEVGASGGTFSFQFAGETATTVTVERGSHAVVEVLP